MFNRYLVLIPGALAFAVDHAESKADALQFAAYALGLHELPAGSMAIRIMGEC